MPAGFRPDTIVAGGDQACDPHERGSGPLYADSLIILDIFPRDAKSGYFGDMTRTVVRGRASEAQRKLWETVKDGQALALRKMKAGRGRAGNSQGKSSNFSPSADFRRKLRKGRQVGFFHGTGHGLGLEIHEYPRLQKDTSQNRTGADGRARPVLSRPGWRAPRRRGRGHRERMQNPVAISKAVGDLTEQSHAR